MKFIATTFLVCAAVSANAASDEAAGDASLSKLQAALVTITKSLPEQLVGEGDWTSQLKCTGDFSSQQPSLNDETACATTDAPGAAGQKCIWCDATKSIGSGLCMSPDQKTMLGQFWDQLCANSSSTPAVNPLPVPPPTPPPVTPPPTPPPTVPAPAPNNDPADQMKKCASETDETACAAVPECAWCNTFLGPGCITSEMKSQIPLCTNNKEVTYLRGDNGAYIGGEGGKMLDPSCLADTSGGEGLADDKDSCLTKKDSNGKSCMWCDAAGMFGICATSDQKDYFGKYMTCEEEDAGVDPAVAVE